MKRILHLGKAKTFMYPLGEEDYQLLREIKTPLIKIDRDHAPMLMLLCERKKIVIEIEPFELLEQKLLESIKKVWPDYIEGDVGDKEIIWQVPKKKKYVRQAQDLARRLQRWYLKNHVKTEVDTRYSKNRYKTTLRKVK